MSVFRLDHGILSYVLQNHRAWPNPLSSLACASPNDTPDHGRGHRIVDLITISAIAGISFVV